MFEQQQSQIKNNPSKKKVSLTQVSSIQSGNIQ